MSAPNASVVAVQDGRVVKLGSSHKLGKYVVLRDVYGDVFTYAGLGSIASHYPAEQADDALQVERRRRCRPEPDPTPESPRPPGTSRRSR